jgi:hypothetical protein
MFATVATIQDYSNRRRRKSGLLAPSFYRPTGLHPQLFTRNLFVSVLAYDTLIHAIAKYDDDAPDEEATELLEFDNKTMNGRNPWHFQKVFMTVCNNSNHYVLALIQINAQTVMEGAAEDPQAAERRSGEGKGKESKTQRKTLQRKESKTQRKTLQLTARV